MRRFEFVGGTSAKFWMAKVEGSVFTVVYGRIGTDGQRKEKEFDDEAAAQKEYDKKVAEKQREGYVEVAADGEAAPAAAPKAAKVAAPVVSVPLPVRVADRTDVDASLVTAATKTLQSLVRNIGNRSWRRRQSAKEAHRALSRIAGVDVAAHPALSAAIDAATDAVLSKPSLPLTVVMRALSSLPTPAVTRALSRWNKPSGAAAPALHVLNSLNSSITGSPDHSELAFRIGRLLVDNDLGDAAALRGLRALRPFIDARVEGGWSAFTAALASHGDVVTERRKQALAAA